MHQKYRVGVWLFLLLSSHVRAESQALIDEAIQREACLGTLPREFNPETNQKRIVHLDVAFDYENSVFSALKGSARDSTQYLSMSKKMQVPSRHLGDKEFQSSSTQDLKEAKKEFMAQMAASFANKKEVWFSYSGHGLLDTEFNWYMGLPVSAKHTKELENCFDSSGSPKIDLNSKNNPLCREVLVSMDEILELAHQSGIRNFFVAADTCHAGVIQYAQSKRKDMNIVAIMSSQNLQLSWGDRDIQKGSIFTSELMKAAQSPTARLQMDLNSNQQLSLAEVMVWVNKMGNILPEDHPYSQTPSCSTTSRGAGSSFLSQVLFDWRNEDAHSQPEITETDSSTQKHGSKND